ncbi:MAG: M23 family metallopeptidase [Cyanobacteriota bacterium]
MKKILLITTILLFSFFNPNEIKAKESCSSDNSVCVDYTKKENGYSMSLKNNNSCKTTLSLYFTELKNLSPNVKIPFTLTLKPYEEFNKIELSIINKSKAWNFRYTFNEVKGNMNAMHDNNTIYQLPYKSGKKYMIMQGFNGKFSHSGEQKYSIDFDVPEGTPVLASREGEVVFVKSSNDIGGKTKDFAKYANYIIIEHSDKTFGAYLHLKKDGSVVDVGDKVKVGELIGYSGSTGWSSAPHLHFWVYKAISGKERESFPIRFKTTNSNSEILLQGNYYISP